MDFFSQLPRRYWKLAPKPYKIIITPTPNHAKEDAIHQVWAMPLRPLTPMSCTTFDPVNDFSKLLVAYQDQSHPSQASLIRSTRICPDFIGRDLAELIETKAIYKGLLVASTTITIQLHPTVCFLLMNGAGYVGYVG